MVHANFPKVLRSFAVMTAIHLINRLPSRAIGLKSLIEIQEKSVQKCGIA